MKSDMSQTNKRGIFSKETLLLLSLPKKREDDVNQAKHLLKGIMF